MVAYVPRMLLIGALTVSVLGGSAAAFFLGARGFLTLDRVVTDTHESQSVQSHANGPVQVARR
jgi:hypothetical protein